MTLIVAIASEKGFRLVGDKRTVDIATDSIVSEMTQKVFYSEKHRIGMAIAGEAELAVNGVSVGSVSDIVKAFLARLDTDDVAFIEAQLTANGISWILSAIQEYINTTHGPVYKYAFMAGVDLLLACFVKHKPMIASYIRKGIDLVILDSQPVSKQDAIEKMPWDTHKALVYCKNKYSIFQFDRIQDKVIPIKSLAVSAKIKSILNINSEYSNRRTIEIDELFELEKLDLPMSLFWEIFTCDELDQRLCFLSNYQMIVHNRIVSLFGTAYVVPKDVNDLLWNNDNFFYEVITDSAKEINRKAQKSVGNNFDSRCFTHIEGQYSHVFSEFKIDGTGTEMVPPPSSAHGPSSVDGLEGSSFSSSSSISMGFSLTMPQPIADIQLPPSLPSPSSASLPSATTMSDMLFVPIADSSFPSSSSCVSFFPSVTDDGGKEEALAKLNAVDTSEPVVPDQSGDSAPKAPVFK